MARVNKNFRKLAGAYLFPEVGRRVQAFLTSNPDVKIMKLGVGNTTEPLPRVVVGFLEESARRLGFSSPYAIEEIRDIGELKRILHAAGYDKYSGYGDEQGNTALRAALAQWYDQTGISIDPSEIFISDGAKTDSANIGSLFELNDVVAVEDPSYPVPVDSNVIAGRTGNFNPKTRHYEGLVYMPCTEENGFFPELPTQKVDIIYLIRPNNPTGAVINREQLKRFVDYAIAKKAAIIFDAAYFSFISRSELPKSIYEIEGAKKCAIEINSFSKWAGFTGLRGGWTVVPKSLKIEDSEPGELNNNWNRRQTTMFNGASLITQAGMLGALTSDGRQQCQEIIDFYLVNEKKIAEGLQATGFKVFSAHQAPYAWVQTPNAMDSWEFFNKLLREAHVVCTPGGGFGPSGDKYCRFSAFGSRETIENAIESIQRNLRL